MTLIQDIEQIREDLDEVRKWVVGNGDPTKGLLWLVADLGKMNSTLVQMIESNRLDRERQMSQHILDGHGRGPLRWSTLLYDAMRQVVVVLVSVGLLLLLLGAESWLRGGRV